MPTINPKILENQIKLINPYITSDTLTIEEWITYTGVHESPNNIVLDGKEKTVMRLGDRWKAGYHDTRYFEASVVIPERLANKKVYLNIDFGGEAIVRINGEIVGAVSSRENSGWVGRNEILFKEKFKGGEKLDIQIEGSIDTAAFCAFNVGSGQQDMEYQLKVAQFTAVDEATESYWFDITTAWQAYTYCDDAYVKPRLFIAMDESVHQLDYDFGKEAFWASVPKAIEKLWSLIEKIEYSTPGEVIMAGHSHLDVAWLWTVREITRKTARTFSNNLALMDNYPDFKFTQSQAVLYDFMKKHYPDIYERVKEKIKNGQWEIVGNAWVEADTNIASGEALIRQLLYGREFFKEEFGVDSNVYWLPDCFGFTWALPQIIKRSGMKYFLTSKLQYNDTNEFPMSVFRWKAHSGDEVLAYMQKVHYQGDYDPEYIRRTRSTNRQNNIVDTSFGMFGYGDGGGGCTYQMLESGKRIEKLPGYPKSRNGKVDDFFTQVEKVQNDLPVWDGEMYYENHRGTFTSQAFVKKNNRQGEYLMRDVELFTILANNGYDKEEIERVWKLLLINQFHDILPGTSIHEVFEVCREEYKEMHQCGNALISKAKTTLESKINPNKDSVIVWNTLTWSNTSTVTVDVPFKVAGVNDMNGNALPCTVKENKNGYTVEFIAKDVPALGYGIFALSEMKADFTPVKAEKNLLENEYLRIVLDSNGNLSEVYDKEQDRQILTGTGNLLTISMDKPIHESAWNMEFDYQMKQWELLDAQSIQIVESSPVKGVIRVVRAFNKSTITQDIILESGKRTVDFDTTVDWWEKEKVLKAVFPVDIRSKNASCEIAHGAAEYPTHYNTSYDLAKFEFCAHKWADLSEGGYGVSILNDCKYGYNVHENVMKITLMRGPNNPDATADEGINTFRYSLYPHAGNWRDADTVKLAFQENISLKPSFIKGNGGNDTGHSFGFISKDNIILDAVKQAQDGNGIIVRVYESETKRTKVEMEFEFDYSKVIECNLMECDETEIPVNGKKFSTTLKPHEVKTFRLI